MAAKNTKNGPGAVKKELNVSTDFISMDAPPAKCNPVAQMCSAVGSAVERCLHGSLELSLIHI